MHFFGDRGADLRSSISRSSYVGHGDGRHSDDGASPTHRGASRNSIISPIGGRFFAFVFVHGATVYESGFKSFSFRGGPFSGYAPTSGGGHLIAPSTHSYSGRGRRPGHGWAVGGAGFATRGDAASIFGGSADGRGGPL